MEHNLRIAIAGAHWVGKTTLFNLMEHKNKIGEVPRELIVETGFNPMVSDDDNMIAKFQKMVMSHQLAHEERFRNEWFVSDRSIYDILSYSLELIEDYDKYLSIRSECLYHNGYDIVFFVPIEFGMEDDGIRSDDEEQRKELSEAILFRLERAGENIVIVTGSVEERMDIINKAISDYVNS